MALQIYWGILWITTILFFVAYIRMRDNIAIAKRDKFEKIILFLIIILLLINIYFEITTTKNLSHDINDCIRFYRYFPNFYNDTQFYFIAKCYNYLSADEMSLLKLSGQHYKNNQLAQILLEKYNISIT